MTKRIVAIIGLVGVIAASFYFGRITVDPGYTGDTEVTDAVFLEVMDDLMNSHYMQPSKEDLLQGAIDGMIASLGDPHTSYFDAEAYEQFQAGFGETYVGIGVSVMYVDGRIIVEEVKSGGPAANVGIRPNDIIAFVDGEDVTGDDFYAILSTIIGEEGTDVTIGVIRSGVEDVIQLTMTRAVIDNSSVNYHTVTEGGLLIGYIEVTTFGDETFEKFVDAIDALETANIDSLIIDLRNNGGGHLNTVYNMMNQFLIDNGKEMFSTEYYIDGQFYIQKYEATNTNRKDYNIVTLVNEFSASASEVFASGMQEHGNYTLVGTVTYGKGTMQTDMILKATLSDRIHISIGKWMTSNGNWVHFNGGSDGITPDIVVEQTAYEKAYKMFLSDGETFAYDQVDDRIQNMQYILHTMGYTVREDGYFDSATRDAIIDIQTANSLTANGIVDSAVLAILNTALDTFQNDPANDTQLLAALSYLVANPTDD